MIAFKDLSLKSRYILLYMEKETGVKLESYLSFKYIEFAQENDIIFSGATNIEEELEMLNDYRIRLMATIEDSGSKDYISDFISVKMLEQRGYKF